MLEIGLGGPDVAVRHQSVKGKIKSVKNVLLRNLIINRLTARMLLKSWGGLFIPPVETGGYRESANSGVLLVNSIERSANSGQKRVR